MDGKLYRMFISTYLCPECGQKFSYITRGRRRRRCDRPGCNCRCYPVLMKRMSARMARMAAE